MAKFASNFANLRLIFDKSGKEITEKSKCNKTKDVNLFFYLLIFQFKS